MIDESNWRFEIVKINEAFQVLTLDPTQWNLKSFKTWNIYQYFFVWYFQHLTRKKDKSEFAVKSWKVQSHRTNLVTKAVDSFSLDPSSDKAKITPEEKKEKQERAQALALEIAANIDSLGSEKQKTG